MIPLEARSLANGIFHSGASMGAILTPLLVLVIVGPNGERWRLVFQVVGALGLVWAVAWLLFVSGKRAEEVSLPKPETVANEVPPSGLAGIFASFLGLMTLRVFWIAFLVSMTINLCWHFYRIWLPLFLDRDLHFNPREVQWILAGFYIAADLGSLGSGYLTRRLTAAGFSVERSRKLVLLTTALMCTLSTPAALVMDPWISLPLIFLDGAGSLGCFPNWLSLTQEISPNQTAVCLGFFGTPAWLMIAVSSPVVGKLVEQIGTFGPCLIAVGFVPLIGALVALWWPEPKASRAVKTAT